MRCSDRWEIVMKHSLVALQSSTAFWDEIELCIEDLKFFPRNLGDN